MEKTPTTGSSSTGSRITTSTNPHPPPQPPQHPITPQKLRPITRFDASNPYPTTFIQADTASFKQVVQMLTRAPPSDTPKLVSTIPPVHYHHHPQTHPKPDPNIQWGNQNNPPIIKSLHRNQSSGFKLYQRRKSSNNLVINPDNPINQYFASKNYVFSGKPEILSPSILDFPSLVLSPVTPLLPDPFEQFGSGNQKSCWWFMNSPKNNGGIDYNNNNNNNNWELDTAAEDKAIKEKGFFLHPSPGTTPRRPEPRLLPLFPVTSPRASG